MTKKHKTYETGEDISLITKLKRYLQSSDGKQEEPIFKLLSRCRGQEWILTNSASLKEHTTQAIHAEAPHKNGR